MLSIDLTCYKCVVVFEKNAKTVQKLAWGAVPLKRNKHFIKGYSLILTASFYDPNS